MKRALIGAVLVVVLGIVGAGWYYAGQALQPGGARVTTPEELVVGAIVDGRITIAVGEDPSGNAQLDTLGLLYPGGYGLLTGPAEVGACPEPGAEGTCVTRDFQLVTGVSPAHATAVRIDEYAVAPGQPSEALGVEVEVLDIAIPGGIAPAWWVPPAVDGGPVAVLVHGRGGARDEMLRIATILQPLGYGILVPSHRGDGVAPDPEDGVATFGSKEWLDVAVAIMDPAVPRDSRLLMVGYSQGAALVGHLLADGDVADRVDAVILDSPLIGLDDAMVLQARLAGIPNVLVRPVLESAYLFARTRGFDFGRGELVDSLAEQPRPILLFHGPDDTFVPVGPSERLAAQDPRGVTYVRVPGVDHVRSWNHDPQAYGAAVTSFLDANF